MLQKTDSPFQMMKERLKMEFRHHHIRKKQKNISGARKEHFLKVLFFTSITRQDLPWIVINIVYLLLTVNISKIDCMYTKTRRDFYINRWALFLNIISVIVFSWKRLESKTKFRIMHFVNVLPIDIKYPTFCLSTKPINFGDHFTLQSNAFAYSNVSRFWRINLKS